MCSCGASGCKHPDSMTDNTLPLIKNLLLLDSEGKRIAVKYYSQEWSVHCATHSIKSCSCASHM